MENQLFYDYASKIIRFINAYCYRYIPMSEITKEFCYFIEVREIMNIIRYLCDNGYIAIDNDRIAITIQTRYLMQFL